MGFLNHTHSHLNTGPKAVKVVVWGLSHFRRTLIRRPAPYNSTSASTQRPLLEQGEQSKRLILAYGGLNF